MSRPAARGRHVAMLVMLVLGAIVPQAKAADATVRATGRFTYVDREGRTVGIRHANVILCDEDGGGVCTTIARGQTDVNGGYDLSGRAGDWWGDLPEVEVRVFASGPSAVVRSGGGSLYCFKTRTVDNATDGKAIYFGSLNPNGGRACATGGGVSGEHGAWAIFNASRQAWEFLRGTGAKALFAGTLTAPGRDVPQLGVIWPHDDASSGIILFNGGGFMVDQGVEFDAESILGAYTYETLIDFLGPFAPDPQDWPGGFASLLTAVMARHWGYVTGPTELCTEMGACGTVESPPHAQHLPNALEQHVAEVAVLWDLYDASPGEDHDFDNSRDDVGLRLDDLWGLMLTDPDPSDPAHQHPRNLKEVGAVVLQAFPGQAAVIRDAYRENHVTPP